ncbi:MAG: hypothetical protein S0880_31315 [Actinomycetota bacterium]|nr:hypothetical protein [Actinomycetota bacterium]
MIARFVAVAVGIWLMAAPAVLDYGDPAATSDRIAGPVGGGIAFVALWKVARSLRWAVFPVGVWLVIAPVVLGYDDITAWVNSIACGLVFVGTVRFGGVSPDQFGGGWRTIWRPELGTWPGAPEPSAEQRAG